MLNITDSITFVTGYQGHGKTLFALAELARCEREEGATIYQMNVNEPDESRFPMLPIPLSEWMTLPPNTVVLVDEAHKDNAIPQRMKESPPAWLKEMAEARKRGIRFIFCTQAGEDVDVFIRRRCARHIHVERKGGMGGAMLYDSPRFFDVTNPGARADTTKKPVKYPTEIFGAYSSAQEHFIKRKIPLKVWAGVALLALCLPAAIVYAVSSGSSLASEPVKAPASAQASAPKREAFGMGSERSRTWATADEFIAAHTPMVAGVPWSAPVFAGRSVRTEPEILCVLSENPDETQRCSCYTEQVTRLSVPDAVCFEFALNGAYNPYRAPPSSAGGGGGREANEVAADPDPGPSAPVGIPGEPYQVGSPRGGEVWGDHPAVLVGDWSPKS